jgi:hypothetical protein
MGTFQMTASSGNSSSSSSHSASLSLTVLRFASCHDCRLELNDGEGSTSRVFRELFRESVRGAEANLCGFEGDGDRDVRLGAERLMLVSDGADGDEKPLLSCLPGAASCVCCVCRAWFICPFGAGYARDLAVLVRSRAEWCVGCGCDRLRPLEGKGLEASKTTRFDAARGIGKDAGPRVASSRLMSSKCVRSPGPM